MSTKNLDSQNIKSDSKRKNSELNDENKEKSDDEDVIDLCDDHDYQVLSAVFETDRGKNIAEILSKIQKDVHLLAMSVHQLIQLSLASQNVRKNNESDEDTSDSEDSDDNTDNKTKE